MVLPDREVEMPSIESTAVLPDEEGVRASDLDVEAGVFEGGGGGGGGIGGRSGSIPIARNRCTSLREMYIA